MWQCECACVSVCVCVCVRGGDVTPTHQMNLNKRNHEKEVKEGGTLKNVKFMYGAVETMRILLFCIKEK